MRARTASRASWVVVITIVVASTYGSAAGSVRVRIDPDDSGSKLDIHKVITNLSDTTLYLRLQSWERFRLHDMRQTWTFALDTGGAPRLDRWVGLA